MTRLTPKRPVRLVPDAFTAAASFLWVSRSWASRWPMSVRNSAASSQRARATGARWGNLLEEAGGLAGADLLADPAGHQVAHHRMQPAGGLVAQAGQVTMPLGAHLEHGGLVLGEHGTFGCGAQRGDRHRQGVVRVVLVGLPGLQQPHPGGAWAA